MEEVGDTQRPRASLRCIQIAASQGWLFFSIARRYVRRNFPLRLSFKPPKPPCKSQRGSQKHKRTSSVGELQDQAKGRRSQDGPGRNSGRVAARIRPRGIPARRVSVQRSTAKLARDFARPNVRGMSRPHACRASSFPHSSGRIQPSFSFSAFQSLPQTPAGVTGAKAGASGSASAAGMVNGAGADHENIRDGAGIDTELVSMPLPWAGREGEGHSPAITAECASSTRRTRRAAPQKYPRMIPIVIAIMKTSASKAAPSTDGGRKWNRPSASFVSPITPDTSGKVACRRAAPRAEFCHGERTGEAGEAATLAACRAGCYCCCVVLLQFGALYCSETG